jgi:ferredoxin-NADP reductase
VVVYRVLQEDDVIFGDELRALAARSGAVVHVVAGDHATPEGAHLLSPAYLRELVPDIGEREVYVCGPPAMADATRKSVRRAHVPSRFIHTERFAL